MKKILTVLMICAALFSLAACKGDSDAPLYDVITEETVRHHSRTPAKDFEYQKTEKGIVISGYTGKDPVVAVPMKIKGTPVIAIEPNVFSNKSIVKGILIPSSITKLEQTFLDNTNLEVAICEGVQNVSTFAFRNCTSLHTLILDESVTTIGEGAFAGCISLKELYLSSNLSDIDDRFANGVFLDCLNLTIKCEKGSYIEKFAREHSINFIII